MDMTQVGISVHPEGLAAAKAAYLADLARPDSPDTFSGWIAAAIDAHVNSGASGRSETIASLEPQAGGRPVSRAYRLPAATVAGIAEAIIADREHGRHTSRSEFARHAIQAATERTKARNGGTLPAAPARLPTGRAVT